MATPERFARRIRAIADRIPLNGDRAIQRAAGAIIATVVPATPVDTGRARGNWQVSLGSDLTAQIKREDKTGASTIAAGESTISQYKGSTSIYIVNNVPYIGRLNQGYSAQAPAGFVEQAIGQAIRQIRGARLLRR